MADSAADLFDVEGDVKITEMEIDNNADSVVVRQQDGTLALREVSTLKTLPYVIDTSGSGFYPPQGVDTTYLSIDVSLSRPSLVIFIRDTNLA